MAKSVEGDWKDFTFKMITPKDYPGVLAHLWNNFYLDELCNKHMGQSEDKNNDMDDIAKLYLQQNLSFMAVHRNTNKIAGVRIFGISKGGEEELGELVSLIKSPVMKAMIPNILTLLEAADTKNRLDVESYGDFLFVSVDRNFRGQGLATEMYQRAIDVLKAERCPAAQSIFTSPHSQRIARNLGFKELSRMKLKDYKTPEGDSLFPNATDDEVAIVMALKF